MIIRFDAWTTLESCKYRVFEFALIVHFWELDGSKIQWIIEQLKVIENLFSDEQKEHQQQIVRLLCGVEELIWY